MFEKLSMAWSLFRGPIFHGSPIFFVRLLISPVNRWRDIPEFKKGLSEDELIFFEDRFGGSVAATEIFERLKQTSFYRSSWNSYVEKAFASLVFPNKGTTRIDLLIRERLKEGFDEAIFEAALENLKTLAGTDSFGMFSEDVWRVFEISTKKDISLTTLEDIHTAASWVMDEPRRGQVFAYVQELNKKGLVFPGFS